ncbi:MAG TPA: hypothetical protein DDW27_09990 [Bacteroidales bacterium]|nr:hypothetical protein [Bacteroidales bacterium]
MKKTAVSFLIIYFAFSAHLSFAQEDIYKQIKTLYDNCDKKETPGGFAAAVIKDGKVIFKKAYGFSNQENNIAFTTATVADYASVSKQFTGFAIAKLITEGKLQLDDDIRSYIPEMPDFGETITIKHLLYHTSGIRDWVGLVKISGRYLEDVITDDFIMKLFLNQKELNFKPGERFQYSNTGYFLLANIISRITGQSFREWTNENIFKPLQMNSTHFSDDYSEIIFNRAVSYKKDINGNFINTPGNLEGYGSSSLFSTLDDMIKWVLNFGSKEIADTVVWNMMLKPCILNNGQKVDYGFGLDLGERFGLKSFGHGGSWSGYLSQVTFYPEIKLASVLIANRNPSGVYVDEKMVKLIMNNKEIQKKSDAKVEVSDPQEVVVDQSLLQLYEGVYKFKDFIFIAEKVDDHLVMHLPWGEECYKVYPESNERFFIKGADLGFSFLRDSNEKVNHMIYHWKGSDWPPALKMDSDLSGFRDIQDLCGIYTSHELKTSYTLKIQNNHLIATHMQNESVWLIRIDKDHYTGTKWWFKDLIVIRDENERITGFRVYADSENIQNLKFEKE